MSKRKSGDTADTMLYSVVQKSKCPRYPERGKVWVANPVIKEVISFDKFINEAASRNSMPKSQLLQAVSLISDELRRQLRKGNRVKLKGIGDFYFSFKCDPYEGDDPSKFKPARIKDVKTVWTPGSQLKSLKTRQSDDTQDILAFKQVLPRKLQVVKKGEIKKNESE